MLIESIAIGLVLGFFLFEWTGLVAGGLIAPGYFALSLERPGTIALCLGVALCTMLCMRLLSRFCLLYGRRRFILCVLVGFVLQWTLGAAVMGTDAALGRVETVGYIIPGLVAHEMDRQGPCLTLLALLALTCAVRLVMKMLDRMPY